MTDTLPTWEFQSTNPAETPRAYAAFLIYRDLGSERSLSKAVAAMKRNEGYVRQMQEWSSANQWVARCVAWDKHQQQLLDDAREKAREQFLKDAETDYDLTLGKWRELAGEIKKHVKGGVYTMPNGQDVIMVKLNAREFKDIVQARDALDKFGRRIFGLPEKITAGQLDVNINVELITQAVEALQAAGADPEDVFRRLIESSNVRARNR